MVKFSNSAFNLFFVRAYFHIIFAAGVTALNISLNSTTIQWVVASITELQQYRVLYGTDPSDLGTSTDPIYSTDSILETDLLFQQSLEDLLQGTTYYVQVEATFDIYTLTSEVISFTTLEPGTI